MVHFKLTSKPTKSFSTQIFWTGFAPERVDRWGGRAPCSASQPQKGSAWNWWWLKLGGWNWWQLSWVDEVFGGSKSFLGKCILIEGRTPQSQMTTKVFLCTLSNAICPHSLDKICFKWWQTEEGIKANCSKQAGDGDKKIILWAGPAAKNSLHHCPSKSELFPFFVFIHPCRRQDFLSNCNS